MSDEYIPCRLELLDGTVRVISDREIVLRPGESVFFSVDPPMAVVHRVWFGSRWVAILKARLKGKSGPNLQVIEGDDT